MLPVQDKQAGKWGYSQSAAARRDHVSQPDAIHVRGVSEMILSEFVARQRNELARFEAHQERAGVIAAQDEDEWFQRLAEFFEDGAQ